MEEAEPGRLTRTDWINAAYSLFEAEGVAAISIGPLSKKLRVTRGSFYWHFADRADLLRAVLDRWHALNTEGPIEQNERLGGPPDARLLHLFETCATDDGTLEMGIRAWASENATAREAVQIVDARRIDYIATLLVQIGIAPAEAALRARVAYSAWLGEYTGAVPAPPQQRLDNIRVLHRLILQT
ncbi:MAG: TetR/AcrR family transcriptional regulator [Paracoccaceae bacterium]